jgi:hypothetical protein
MVGSRGSGTIGPPDDTTRTARHERAHLRLVTLPPTPVRKSLPPESAPFDPELEPSEARLEHRQDRRRVVRLQTRTWRSLRRVRLPRRRVAPRGQLARVHVPARLLVAAIAVFGTCIAAIGVLAANWTTSTGPPSRSSSLRAASSALANATDGHQAALIIDPFQHLQGRGHGTWVLEFSHTHVPRANGQIVRGTGDPTTTTSHSSVTTSVNRTTQTPSVPSHVSSTTNDRSNGSASSQSPASKSSLTGESRTTSTPACTIYPGSGGCLP